MSRFATRAASWAAPPTGRRFEAKQMHIIRVANGQIAEHWGVRDDAGMMRQLGLVSDQRGGS
ncbi:MAG TPA: ester cyclase [Marmoricola sp.]|nr:ester cyclase [Marmoricola sp.]HNI70756.1 ester cyclase [Marmoricola sp.]HNN49307.1 ester cyclase [Marmoricola sp.]